MQRWRILREDLKLSIESIHGAFANKIMSVKCIIPIADTWPFFKTHHDNKWMTTIKENHYSLYIISSLEREREKDIISTYIDRERYWPLRTIILTTS